MPSESGNLGVRNRPGRLVPGLFLVRRPVMVYTVHMARISRIVFISIVARKSILVFIWRLARRPFMVFINCLARKRPLVFTGVMALSVKLPLSVPIQNNKGVSVNFRHGPHAGHTMALSFPDRQGCVLPARNGLGTI